MSRDVLIHQAQDQGIKAEHVEQMRAAIKAAGKKAEIIVYPDAQHGFSCDERGSYQEAAAKLAWQRTMAFLAKNVKK